MSRRLRFALLVLVVAAAGALASSASALSWVDSICPPETTGGPKVCPTGLVGTPYSLQIKGRNGCWPADGSSPGDMVTLSVSSGALPPGLSMSSSGLISGTPTQAGNYSFFISETDHAGVSWCEDNASSQKDFSISVDPRVLITNQVPPPGTVGTVYSLALVAVIKSGPDATSPPSSPLTWTLLSGQLPPGLAMTSDGVISGTPTTTGDFTFTLKAALADGRSDTKTQTITVRDAVKVGSTGVAGRSEVGVPFDADLTATGGTGTFTWSLSAGSLPRGVTLAADGSVSGTPRESGRFPFTATVTDTENRTANVSGVLAVAPRLTVTTKLLRLGKVGKLYRAKLVATGGVIPKIWKVTQGPFPRGVRLDRTTGIISGTPRKAGTYRITVQVTDAFQVVSTRTLRLIVVA